LPETRTYPSEAALQIACVALSRSQVLHPGSQLITSPLLAIEDTLVEDVGATQTPPLMIKLSLQEEHPVESQTRQLLPQATQVVPLG
jgi:hypothetical protein